MTANASAVPRSLRIGSFLLSALLMLLFWQLLGFVLEDIGDHPGPDWQGVLVAHEDADDRQHSDELAAAIAENEWRVARQEELQQDLNSSMTNARGTMQQMMDLQRLSLQQGVPASEADAASLAQAQERFLQAQDRFEQANAEITASNEARYELRLEQKSVDGALDVQRELARAQYDLLMRAHGLRVASWKLAFIVPLFLFSAWLFSRQRRSAYRPILLAALAASFWRVGLVMHAHFPEEYFKYIATLAPIGIALAFLVWLLRKAARPGRELLLTRYREAYRAHMCPVCAFPMARGPLRFAVWTRKGPRAAAAAASAESGAGAGVEREPDAPYACPSCGTSLFAGCASCGSLRHTLLPFCEHCGDERYERDDGPLAATG